MNILAIDTTTKTMIVGIKKFNVVHKNRDVDSIKHLEYLMPEIDRMLSEAEMTIDNIDIVSVVVGPGSFTGIRIGVATALGLSTRKQFKTIPVNSLDLIAYINNKRSNTRENVTCIIPSSLNKYYVADYYATDRIGDIYVKTIDEIRNDEQLKNKKVVCLGDNAYGYQEIMYDAQDLIDYTEKMIVNNNYAPLTPCYVSLSQAERELLAKEATVGSKD